MNPFAHEIPCGAHEWAPARPVKPVVAWSRAPSAPVMKARMLPFLVRAAVAGAGLLTSVAAHAQAAGTGAQQLQLAPAATSPAPSGPGVVTLHIESPEPLFIQEHVGSQRSFVCASPCDRLIDGRRGQTFSASGDLGSTSFVLTGMQGNAELDVYPGSSL